MYGDPFPSYPQRSHGAVTRDGCHVSSMAEKRGKVL